MKKTGKCPKCGRSDIVTIFASESVYGNIISGKTIFTLIRCQRFVCCCCGFIEEWVEDKEDIDKLKERYSKYTKPVHDDY